MKELLTISEYSKIRECSVSAVYKRLKSPSNKIHQFVVKEGGQTFLKAEILEFEGYRQPDPEESIQDQTSNTTPKAVEEVEEVEEKKVEEGIGALTIRVLEQQLLQKDKEIAELNRRLEEASIHEREMSDKLVVLANQANELQRNNQLLLAQAQQKPMIEAPEEPEVPKKESFWKRIFK